MMQQTSLLSLLAAATSVSAGVIKIPLKTRAAGVNVPVTDWFNRTDNQVYIFRVVVQSSSNRWTNLLLVV